MTRTMEAPPKITLTEQLTLLGNEDEQQLTSLMLYIIRRFDEPGIRQIMTRITFPCAETEEAQDESAVDLEKRLEAVGRTIGWSLTLSDRKNADENRLLEREDNSFHDMMHDVGAKGRRAYYESMQGKWSAYYTATKL